MHLILMNAVGIMKRIVVGRAARMIQQFLQYVREVRNTSPYCFNFVYSADLLFSQLLRGEKISQGHLLILPLLMF